MLDDCGGHCRGHIGLGSRASCIGGDLRRVLRRCGDGNDVGVLRRVLRRCGGGSDSGVSVWLVAGLSCRVGGDVLGDALIGGDLRRVFEDAAQGLYEVGLDVLQVVAALVIFGTLVLRISQRDLEDSVAAARGPCGRGPRGILNAVVTIVILLGLTDVKNQQIQEAIRLKTKSKRTRAIKRIIFALPSIKLRSAKANEQAKLT